MAEGTAAAASHPTTVKTYVLCWVDGTVNGVDQPFQSTLEQLRAIVSDVYAFSESDECVDFLTEIEDREVLLAVSGGLCLQLVPCIHSMAQINTIFIHSDHPQQHEQWIKEWSKIQGIYKEIQEICDALNRIINPSNSTMVDQNQPNNNLNRLDPTFMYTQILKKMLLNMEYNRESREKLTRYWRELFAGNPCRLALIDEFHRNYRPEMAVWWYTRPSFIHPILDRSLRLFEIDILIKMGFFIQDLHRQIEQLHKEQLNQYSENTFFVFRGQGLSSSDLEKLRANHGGLISFNDFLSTHRMREIAVLFAEGAAQRPDMTGVIFVMTIDPKLTRVPFVDIQQISYFPDEEEILFSMHAVFRIGTITAISDQNQVFKVQLSLTEDYDSQLESLSALFEQEFEGGTNEGRLGRLLMRAGKFSEAEQLYLSLLEQAPNDYSKGTYYQQLGSIQHHRGNYQQALRSYEEALDVFHTILPYDNPPILACYNDMGLIYHDLGEYAKALSYYQRALQVYEKTLPDNHLHLGTTFNNIGLTCSGMGDQQKALIHCEKALDIYQKILPDNHPDLAVCYDNIGSVYYHLGECSKALSYYQIAFAIKQLTLPVSHPDMSISYDSFGRVYNQMGEYTTALTNYEKAIDIKEKVFTANHPSLAVSYNGLGTVHANMGDYSKALEYYKKALDTQQHTLPVNHPHLVTSHQNMANIYKITEEYAQALPHYEKVMDTYERSPPEDRSDLASLYHHIGGVYGHTGDYPKALSFYEKSLDIFQKILPAHDPSLATGYNNIALVFENLGEYSKALIFFEQTLDIEQRSLPSDHPRRLATQQNIETMRTKLAT